MIAIDRPVTGEYVAIAGGPGTGKSVALVSRALRALAELSGDSTVLMTAPSASGLVRLRDALEHSGSPERIAVRALSDVAYEILAAAGSRVVRIDDVDALDAFVRAAGPLVEMSWEEVASARVDPEISGMDRPARFLTAAFRLIRKLRAAGIGPNQFATLSLQGATAFYGHPPVFTSPDLFGQTNRKYRDSLRVDAEELTRQHGREIDLIKIVRELYERYLSDVVGAGLLAPADATIAAAELLEGNRPARERAIARYAFAFVDDAQDLMPADLALLRAIYGDDLRGVTVAGDPGQASRSFAGARGAELFNGPSTIELGTPHRGTPAIAAIAARAKAKARVVATRASASDGVRLERFGTIFEEASATARRVAELIRDGTPPHEIAVIARTLHCVGPFLSSLLDRNIRTTIAGEANLLSFREVEDALAPLWSLADPFRHDWLLRSLSAPWLALSDASIATLCAERSSGQEVLFALPEPVDATGRKRDRTRSVRLALATFGGESDADLPQEARERLERFRGAHARWARLERSLGVRDLARVIIAETAAPRETASARGAFAAELQERLDAAIGELAARDPLASLRDVLVALERRANAETDGVEIVARPERDTRGCVNVLGVEAAKGREFAHVFIVDVHAGAFPRYFVPESFLFTSRYGMIPKNNVGEAAATRTAKFTYVTHQNRTVAKYNEAERKALVSAIGRARESLWISASGKFTSGANTPEFLAELI